MTPIQSLTLVPAVRPGLPHEWIHRLIQRMNSESRPLRVGINTFSDFQIYPKSPNSDGFGWSEYPNSDIRMSSDDPNIRIWRFGWIRMNSDHPNLASFKTNSASGLSGKNGICLDGISLLIANFGDFRIFAKCPCTIVYHDQKYHDRIAISYHIQVLNYIKYKIFFKWFRPCPFTIWSLKFWSFGVGLSVVSPGSPSKNFESLVQIFGHGSTNFWRLHPWPKIWTSDSKFFEAFWLAKNMSPSCRIKNPNLRAAITTSRFCPTKCKLFPPLIT